LLSVIGTFNYILHKKTEDNSPLRVYINQIDKAVKKGADLINGMLEYSSQCRYAKEHLLMHNKASEIQCWEYMKCGCEKQKSCPVVLLDAGRMCWDVSNTICGGKKQGKSYTKFLLCSECEFFIKLNSGEF
ncbi:MAG TPA: hypothetical protein VJW95_03300, partial [Dissulfurispiraceae bacterium]|nr:hypothetical protein [Dissulfurispiraceae bacterium]